MVSLFSCEIKYVLVVGKEFEWDGKRAEASPGQGWAVITIHKAQSSLSGVRKLIKQS